MSPCNNSHEYGSVVCDGRQLAMPNATKLTVRKSQDDIVPAALAELSFHELPVENLATVANMTMRMNRRHL